MTDISQPHAELQAALHFLSRDDKFRTEKPYTCRYDTQGLYPSTNIIPERCELTIRDMRDRLDSLTFEHHGFRVMHLDTGMAYTDFDFTEIIEKKHIPKIESLLLEELEASRIFCLEFDLRRRHPSFPTATGKTYQHFQPGSRVHIDFSHEGVREMLQRRWGDKAHAVLTKKWRCINVWHPLRAGPLVDWPLALCDASTVDFDTDTMASDVVDRDDFFENTQVQYNSAQEWYWLSNQLPSELLVFKNGDSESVSGKATAGAPHASFDNPLTKPTDPPRESIEIRFLVVWDD